MGAIAEAAAALQDAKRRVDRRAHLGRQEQRLQDELDGAREELARLADVVRTEGNHVATLERRGLSSLVAAMTGGRKERLDREHVDLQADHRIAEARATVNELRAAPANQIEHLDQRRAAVRAELTQAEALERDLLSRAARS